MRKFKKSYSLLIVPIIAILFTIPTYASEQTLTFTVAPAEDLPSADAQAIQMTADIPMPTINSDGTFTFETSGGVGETLVSSTFKFSGTTSKITLGAYSTKAKSYTVYLEKKSGLIWTTVKTVTYYTGGDYEYTFTNLDTSATYRLRFFSPDGKIIGTGSISNYAG